MLISLMRNLGIELNYEEDKETIITSYLGIKTDTANFNDNSMEKIDKDAKAYLEGLLNEDASRVISYIENASTPMSWLNKLGEVLHALPVTKMGVSDVFSKGIGVIDDGGIVPYVADFIFSTQNFKTVIIYGLSYNLAKGTKYDELAIKASGRSNDNAIKLSEVFSEVFYKLDENGNKLHVGGGKKTTLASAGADIPLSELSELGLDGLQKAYELWEKVIDSRIETVFKTKKE